MTAQRMLFITVAVFLMAGIYFSGWQQVHWLLYILTGLVSFAAITGICPTLIIYRKLGFK